MGNMRGKRTFTVSALLFGKENSPTYSYQNRQSKLVFSGSLPAAFWIAVVWFAASQSLVAGLVVAFRVFYFKIHFVAAVASDAVFDSLWERINLQSRWLDFRLTQIDGQLNWEGRPGRSGQELWGDHAFEGQLSDAWSHYPEKELPPTA
jgi:hypothetical protein